MLFNRKSVVTGMASHPVVRCVLPSGGIARLLPEHSSVNHPPFRFKATTKIQCTAGRKLWRRI